MSNELDETNWSPELKVVAVGIAAVLAWLLGTFAGVDTPPGAEAGIAAIVAYWLPNRP